MGVFNSILPLLLFNLVLLVPSHSGLDLKRTDDISLETVAAIVNQQAASIQSLHADVNALQAQTQVKDAQIAALTARMDDVTTPVVFTAMPTSANTYVLEGVIKFSSVIVDTAHVYDDVTGIVTIPRSGSYFIYVSADPNDQEILGIEVRVNNVVKVTAWAEGGSPSSAAVTLRLNQGDRVWAVVNINSKGTVVEVGSIFTIHRIAP